MRVQTLVNTDAGWSETFPPVCEAANTLVLAFGARRRDGDTRWLDELRHAYPAACLIGCSTSGEIVGEQLLDDSISVAIVEFDRSSVRSATVRTTDYADSRDAGVELGRRLLAEEAHDADGAPLDLASVLVFADGTSTNGSALVAGLQYAIGPSTPVSGGLAGDGDRFEQTWVLSGDRFGPDLITVVGLYGASITTGYGSCGGWMPFGPERVVTSSDANVLHELDGQPALPLYRSYLGDLAEGLPASALFFPLCIWPEGGSSEPLARTVLGIDIENDSMTFAGDIPLGWRAQLMLSNPEDLIDAAGDAATESRSGGHDACDALALAVSCVGRRLVLGASADDELLAVADSLPAGTTVVGFYSYGEISTANSVVELHNQTMTVTTIREVDS